MEGIKEKEGDFGQTPNTSKNRTPKDKNLSDDTPSLQEVTTPIKEQLTHKTVKLSYPTQHLIGFEELAAATALFGSEYTLIFKALWYNLLSYRIRTSKISVGRMKPDGRLSMLYIVNSGRGKGELKRVQKDYINYFNGKCREPTSLHAEQLVGKSVYNKKEKKHEERRGYLRADFLIIDEAFNLLSSKELHYSEARKYIRTALDPYPLNVVSKQLTELGEDHVLEYTPECPINLFVQPLRFENDILVLEGDIRRFIPVYVFMGDNDKTDALKRRVFDSFNDEDSIQDFCNYVNKLMVFESFNMDSSAKTRFAELSIYMTEHGESYSPKIANFIEMVAFTLQNKLLKFAAIQAFQHGRNVIEVIDVEIAYVDLFEILEHAYGFVEYKIPGSLDYGDGWQGARSKDQEALKWLYEKGATSEEESNVSIQEYEDKLSEIFNIKDRQARKYKNKHETKGWVKTRKAPNISKIWLGFRPNPSDPLPALPAIGAPYQEYKKLVKKIKELPKVEPEGGAGNASIAGIEKGDIPIGKGDSNLDELTNEDLWNISQHGTGPTGEKAEDALNERLIKKEPVFSHTEDFIKNDILQIVETRPGSLGTKDLSSEALRKGGDETTQEMVRKVLLKMIQCGMIAHKDGKFIPSEGS